MLHYGVTFSGASAQDIKASAQAIRPGIRKEVGAGLRLIRKTMGRMAGGEVLGVRSGRTRQAIRRGKISTRITGGVVNGTLKSRALLLNIFEKGANRPERTVEPRKAFALRYFRGGQIAFAGGQVTIPAHHLRARPVIARSIRQVQPVINAKIRNMVIQMMRLRGFRAAG